MLKLLAQFFIVVRNGKDCPLVTLPREEKEDAREDGSRILPILALNEVFIGESLSSRVSYLELQVAFYSS